MKYKEYKLLLLLILITGFFYLIFIADFRLQSITLSGDSYYDEKCIDTSQYLLQGYASIRTDENGCAIVGKSVVLATRDLGANLRNCWGNEYYKTNGGTTDYNVCRVTLGDGWVGSCYDRIGNTYGGILCSLMGYEEKGGLERVLNYCSYDAGDILVAESFAGARTINKNDLRYPIKSFCRAHPAIITSGQTSYTSTNVPQDLIDGKSVSINAGETLTIFYSINNLYNLPDKCVSSNNLALDLSTNLTCKSTLGFTYLCTEGVFDAATGSCTVVKTAECGAGERLVINTDGSRACVYNPPLQVSCPPGYTFDISIDACYKVPESVNVCGLPYELYEPTQTECEGTWQNCPQCPVDKICDQAICKAQCSEGIECRRYLDISTICAEGEIVGRYCVLNGTNYKLCGSDEVWNKEVQACIIDVETVSNCSNGTLIDNVCYKIPDGYIKCPASQVLNDNKCVTMSELYDVEYKDKNYIVTLIIGAIVIILLIIAYKYAFRK